MCAQFALEFLQLQILSDKDQINLLVSKEKYFYSII